MHVDILKVPHHGSDNNLGPDFFERVTADHYVFSGDGEHGNPERGTFDMLVEARGEDGYKVHLTYPVDEIDTARQEDWEKEQGQGGRRERRPTAPRPRCGRTGRTKSTASRHSSRPIPHWRPMWRSSPRTARTSSISRGRWPAADFAVIPGHESQADHPETVKSLGCASRRTPLVGGQVPPLHPASRFRQNSVAARGGFAFRSLPERPPTEDPSHHADPAFDPATSC